MAKFVGFVLAEEGDVFEVDGGIYFMSRASAMDYNSKAAAHAVGNGADYTVLVERTDWVAVWLHCSVIEAALRRGLDEAHAAQTDGWSAAESRASEQLTIMSGG